MIAAIRSLLAALDIDPDTARCPATTDHDGAQVRCRKLFDGHDAHVGMSRGKDVVW